MGVVKCVGAEGAEGAEIALVSVGSEGRRLGHLCWSLCLGFQTTGL